MADRLWVRIRSWHAVRLTLPTRAGAYATLCGRLVPAHADTSDTLPAGKSCETCLRLHARQTDAPAPENEAVVE